MNETHLAQILHQLADGKRITTLSVLISVKTFELRHYIAIIRKIIQVNDIWVNKNGKRFKEYFL